MSLKKVSLLTRDGVFQVFFQVTVLQALYLPLKSSVESSFIDPLFAGLFKIFFYGEILPKKYLPMNIDDLRLVNTTKATRPARLNSVLCAVNSYPKHRGMCRCGSPITTS